MTLSVVVFYFRLFVSLPSFVPGFRYLFISYSSWLAVLFPPKSSLVWYLLFFLSLFLFLFFVAPVNLGYG